MSISIVNDNLNIGNLNQAVASNPRIPVSISAATYDLHTANKLTDSSMYYNFSAICTITLPANYATYRGRVLHFVNTSTAAISLPASSATSGSVIGLNGSSVNSGILLAATAPGSWASLVCDGSSTWYVFASG